MVSVSWGQQCYSEAAVIPLSAGESENVMNGSAALAMARGNLERLRGYIGDGVVVGCSDDGDLIQAFFFTDWNAEFEECVLRSDRGGRVWMEPARSTKHMSYDVMCEQDGCHIVGNGRHVHTLKNAVGRCRQPLSQVLENWEHMRDASETPRIVGIYMLRGGKKMVDFSIIRRGDEECERFIFSYRGLPHPGLGYCLTTFSDVGTPPRVFKGEPYLVALKGDHDQILKALWAALDPEDRIALAVKVTDSSGKSVVKIIKQDGWASDLAE